MSVDVSFNDQDQNVGIGVVIRDSTGKYILSTCPYLAQCSDAFEAELFTVKEGSQVAFHYTAQPVIFQTDCAMLLKTLKGSKEDRSRLGQIVTEVKELINEQRELILVKLKRNQNRVPDSLANLSRLEHLTDFGYRIFLVL